MTDHCKHLSDINPQDIDIPDEPVCKECIEMDDPWVHLRICTECGHIGCCDSSKNKHATKHHHRSGHAVVLSAEPAERWAWCYKDEEMMEY